MWGYIVGVLPLYLLLLFPSLPVQFCPEAMRWGQCPQGRAASRTGFGGPGRTRWHLPSRVAWHVILETEAADEGIHIEGK